MSNQTPVRIEGALMHVVYGSQGGIEGVLLEANGVALQLVIELDDALSAEALTGIAEGQTVVVEASPQGPLPMGESVHALYELCRLVSVDGKEPMKPKFEHGAAYQGTVVRFNYARHGVANGVVLDSGDFIHTSSDGLAQLKLKVGDTVQADGDAHLLATGLGWAVEASMVNGKPVDAH
jgi:hypothetical protein